jgi:metal transporter CNNM
MTPLSDTFMLEINSIVDYNLLKQIYTEGYSRIPIYEEERDNVVGVLMTKDLILIDSEQSLLTLK